MSALVGDASAAEPTAVEQLDAGLVRVPLRTPTLPPATHTHSYLVRGDTGWWVVDVGPSDPTVLRRLRDAVDAYAGGWRGVRGLLLTHHHPDHVGGLAWWREQTAAPVYAHAATADALGLSDGTVAVCGDARSEVVDGLTFAHTPGHASGHVAVLARGHAVSGDLTAGVGTIVVDPPDGDMAAYLASLRWLRDQRPRGLHPSHGPSTSDAVARLDAYIDHRLARESQVLAALGATPRSTEVLAALVYPELPPMYLPLAERSVLAHLLKLATEGRAGLSDAGWRAG